MANEVTFVEIPESANAISFKCANNDTFTKGEIGWLSGGRYISGAGGLVKVPFAGIVAADKEASDGATTVAAYPRGSGVIIDAVCRGDITYGQAVMISGANGLSGCGGVGANQYIDPGIVVGVALEGATDGNRAEILI